MSKITYTFSIDFASKFPMNSLNEQQFQDIPLSISECAKIFGLSEKTVRRAVKDNEIPYMVVKGRYRILFADMLGWSQMRPRLQHSRDERGVGQYVVKWQIPSKHLPTKKTATKETNQLTFFDNTKDQLGLF